jgi:putative flippase GtrA
MLSLAWDCLPLIAIICPIVFAFFLHRTKVHGAQVQKNNWVKFHMFISVSLAVAAASFILVFLVAVLCLPGFTGGLPVIIVLSPLVAAVFGFYKRIVRLRNQKRAEVTIRFFLATCLLAVGLIVALPPTNIWVSLAAGALKENAMRCFVGTSTEVFIAVFGQPDGQSETSLDYYDNPFYSYGAPDDDLKVVVRNDTVRACISH